MHRPITYTALLAALSSLCVQVYGGDSFLSDTLVRKGQVKQVLEHQPVKSTSCHKAEASPLGSL